MDNSDEKNQVFLKQVFEQIENYEELKPLTIALPMELMSTDQKSIYYQKLKAYHEATRPYISHLIRPTPPVPPTIQIGGSRRKKSKGVKHTNQVSVSQAVREQQISQANVAVEAVASPGVRGRICAALRAGTNDAFEIGKVLTPILLPLSLAGTIAIPATPIAIAAISLIVARVGVSAFCASVSDTKLPDNERTYLGV